MEKNLRTFSKALFFRSSTAGTLADVFIFFYCFPVQWNILQTGQLYVEDVSQFLVDIQDTFSKEMLYMFCKMIHSHFPCPLRNVSQVLLGVGGCCNR